jgi:hypothetical protein
MAAASNHTGPKPVYINDIVTPIGRLSFPHLAEPDRKGPGKSPYADDKYKATLLMAKQGTDFSGLRAAALRCAQEAWGASIKSLNDFQSPFRDGDTKFDAEGNPRAGHAGMLYITCKSKARPITIGRNKEGLDPAELYGGCQARFVVTAMSYVTTENVRQPNGTLKTESVRGVTFLLNVVQKMGEGEAFGGSGGGGGNARAVAALPDDGGAASPTSAQADASDLDAEAMFR